ncbi:MAG: MBL fold metallo-hydrolase [Rhodospirillaceae bacterium]|nr:MBL fold metallo-hydrolase [Rhodospirillaceae bacterium]
MQSVQEQWNTNTGFAVSALALLAAALPPQGVAQEQGIDVTLLGTGDPVPRVDRFGPAILVEAGEYQLLFDAGRGVTQRLQQLEISLSDIDAVFITHFHSDHLSGLPDLWLTGWLPPPFGRRSQPMRVIGPDGLSEILTGLRQAFDPDIQIRLVDEQLPPRGIEFDIREYSEDGIVFDEEGVTVTAFAVDHGQYIKPSYGYRVDHAGRSVVLSGDTRFDENLIEAARGADVVIHEVAAAREEMLAFDERIQLILDHHTTPEEAGMVFDRVGPKLALYSHLTLLSSPESPEVTVEELIQRTRTNYTGRLLVGEDLMRLEIGESVGVYRFPY